jgi:hypothetical protein
LGWLDVAAVQPPQVWRIVWTSSPAARIDAEEKTAGGIIIPDTAKEKPSQGKIVALGLVRMADVICR